MSDFDDVRKKAKLKTRVLPLCLDGEVLEEIDRLEAQLAQTSAPANLGDGSRREIAEAIAGAQERMRESIVEFHLRAQPARQWTKFYLTHPDRGENEDRDAYEDRLFPWYAKAVALTCTDPVMTVEQVGELVDLLHLASWNQLVGACLAINGDKLDVPNSEAASALTRDSGPA